MRPRPWIAILLSILLSPLIFPSPAPAETDVIEEAETKRSERQLEIESAIKKAAKEAEARQPLETRERVTYAQVLEHPDDLDLNFRYAKTQVAEGDWVGASATLERLLMIKPDLAPVRFFRALVLYRLDNLEEAEQEFRLLREMELPEAQRRQVAQHLRAIVQRRRRTTLTVSTSLGWGFDANRNASPSSKQRLSSDALTALTGTARKRRDTYLLAINSLSIAHDLGSQSGHQLIGSFDYFLGEQTSVDDLDLQSFALEGGAVLQTPLLQITPTGFANYLYLSRETFLRSQGVNVEGGRDIGDRTSLSVSGRWAREDFTGTNENPTAPQRSGSRVSASFIGRYRLTPTMQLAADLGYEHKAVLKLGHRHNAYEGVEVTGTHTWLLGKGQFVLSSLSYTVNSYDQPDSSVSARTRRDKQLRARAAYGAPAGLLLGRWLPEAALRDLTATCSVEQLRSLSNITNYTYSNTKLGVMLTKRVEF